MRVGELGYWWSSLGGAERTRPMLEGSREADVAVVGGGLTGLWSAYYLKRARPELEVVILEREMVGFGASGRNGGWLAASFSGPRRLYERAGGQGAYEALCREMVATVEEVGAVLRRHAIDADLVKGGQLTVALSRAQLARLRGWLAGEEAAGLGGSGTAELSAADLEARVRIAGALGAGFFPHVARVHPAKLVSGLARAVEELGVRIHEGSGVREIGPGHASTAAGTVRARWIVRATEGYTPSLRRWRRALAPINSSMIVTEPLGETAWQEIGWEGREVISDEAHVYVYLQRTEDGRIAIGGRGVPYRYGSRDDGRGATAASTIASLRDRLERMFPPARGARVAHAWSGVLGVARDWGVSVGVDRRTGLGWAGGYVGEGVAASNLAGRVISALILESGSPLTRLAWVGRRAPRWEPEPLRWVEIRTVYGLYRLADRIEARTGRPALLGRLVDRASGRV